MPAVPLKLHERAQVPLKIAPRQEQGKGPVGQLRRSGGQIPGVLYGHKQAPCAFKTDAHDFEQILSKILGPFFLVVEPERYQRQSRRDKFTGSQH